MQPRDLPFRATAVGLSMAVAAATAPALPQHLAGKFAGPPGASAVGPAPEIESSVRLTRIRGTPLTLQPSALVANLDAGNQVAGWTWWALDGIIYVETRVGFLWRDGAGSEVFAIPPGTYYNDNWHLPAEIADDGTVVGTNLFTKTLVQRPFRYTSASGFAWLQLPNPDTWSGGAEAVSADGNVAGGWIQPGVFADSLAARWVGGVLQILGDPGQVSLGRDLSDDGTVLVGAAGPAMGSLQAARWVGGTELPLDLVPGASSSEATFVSGDGTVAIGTAAVGGRQVLARWSVDGSVETYDPPAGLSVQAVHAIAPRATAAVGTLTDQVPFDEDWDPFLWRLEEGWTRIDELADPGVYQFSEALDVADDGRTVVGQLQAKVVFEGEPRTIAFRWTPETGTQDLDALVAAAGKPDEGLYEALAISGDGKRILCTGVRRPTPQDTSSVIVEFVNGPPLY